MNTTVAIVLPEWLVYMLVILISLQAASTVAVIYRDWLAAKLERERTAKLERAAKLERERATER